MSTGAPTEAELTLAHEAIAKEKLARARRLLEKTTHLPPGNEARDFAVDELRRAEAIAQEWGIA